MNGTRTKRGKFSTIQHNTTHRGRTPNEMKRKRKETKAKQSMNESTHSNRNDTRERMERERDQWHIETQKRNNRERTKEREIKPNDCNTRTTLKRKTQPRDYSLAQNQDLLRHGRFLALQHVVSSPSPSSSFSCGTVAGSELHPAAVPPNAGINLTGCR